MSIFITNESDIEYPEVYDDIIKDIAAQWDKMSSMEQAGLVETLAGTRQQNVFSSLITQFQEAEGAMNSMQDSAGELENLLQQLNSL